MASELLQRLPQLQNLIKRDPSSYREEFLLQLRHYHSELQIFKLHPGKESDSFTALVTFLSHVAPCYPKDMAQFPTELLALLHTYHEQLSPALRRSLVQNLVMLRNRGMLEPVPLLQELFSLFRCHDKGLRELLHNSIVADIRGMNAVSRNEKVNRAMQKFMFTLLQEEDHTARRSLKVVVELYKRKVWTDARTVNVIATACLAKDTKLCVAGLRFFLGIEREMLEAEEREKDVEVEVDEHKFSKKTRKRQRQTEKQKKRLKKQQLLKMKEPEPLFPAIQLVNDPQGFAEKLFKSLRSCGARFEVRLMMMDMISRFIGFHKLILLTFYPFVQRYLTAHQEHVPRVLAYLIQACHDLVPPEDVRPVVMTIANNFVADRCSPELIAVGLNSVREIVLRTPLVLEEEGMDGFVRDLAGYRTFKDKGVMIAARGFINAVRAVHPTLLKKKDRGRLTDKSLAPRAYGELNAAQGVDGAELLQQYEEERLARLAAGEDVSEWGEEEELEESDSDEGGWVNVSHSSEEEEGGLDVDGESDEEEEEEEEAGSNDDDDSEEEEEMDSDDEDQWEDVDDDDDDDNDDDDDEAEEEATAEQAGSAGSRAAADAAPAATATATAAAGGPLERIEARRILTERDFQRIALLKQKAQLGSMGRAGKAKRKRVEAMLEQLPSAVVDPEELEGYRRKRRRALDERLASVMEGREEHTSKQRTGGSTNQEKRRHKNFLMLRKSSAVQQKLKSSLKDQQRALKKQLKSMVKVSVKRLKGRRKV